MKNVQCNLCGSESYEERRIEYLYSHKGKYLLVSNTPVEVCLNFGMIYYDAAVLKEIERRFPNEEACVRLVSALAMEQTEAWLTGPRYLDITALED
jgi:YgiT-type zinc finger domain-containing protein